MEIKTIFTSILAEETLDVDNSALEEIAYKLNATTGPGLFQSNEGGWHSESVRNNTEFAPLIKQIEDKANELYLALGFSEKFKMEVGDIWVNINRSRDYNKPHIHPGCFFSGCYYVKAAPGSGSIEFLHTVPCIRYAIPLSTVKHANNYNSMQHQEPPMVGKCLFFSPWIEHQVQPNHSNEDRISIAFNCFLTNNVN